MSGIGSVWRSHRPGSLRPARAVGRLVAAVALAAGLAATPSGAPAQSGAGDAAAAEAGWAYDVWNETMSPFCPGRTLADCPSPQADALRSWIMIQAEEGRSRDSVEQELLARYGEEILSAPRARGFGLAAYAIPMLAFVAGGVLVAIFLRRRTADVSPEAGASEPERAAPTDPELERLLDEELLAR